MCQTQHVVKVKLRNLGGQVRIGLQLLPRRFPDTHSGESQVPTPSAAAPMPPGGKDNSPLCANIVPVHVSITAIVDACYYVFPGLHPFFCD